MIQIDDKYFIKMDTYSYVLCEKTKNKENPDDHVELTYHQTIQGLLKSYARRNPRKRKVQTYDGLIRVLNEINKNINKFIEDTTIADVKEEYQKYREKIEEEYAFLKKSKRRKKEN